MEQETPKQKGSAGDHLANERTFLAWIRTSIGIMGFGFVVVKFSLFMKQIALALGAKVEIHQTAPSRLIGVLLVALGGFTIAFSYLRYMSTKKQLEQASYYHSTYLIKILASLIFIISILLMIYLLKTT